MQFQRKLINYTWENSKNWAQKIFSWILPLLDVRHYCKLLLYTISKKTNELNLRKWQKTYFWARFWTICPKFGLPIFFAKIWLHQLLDNMASYYHVQYQKKLMIQSWKNLVTDGQKEGSAALWIWKKDQQQKNAVEYENYDGKT